MNKRVYHSLFHNDKAAVFIIYDGWRWMDASSQFQDSLPISSDALLEQLGVWELLFDYWEHEPLRTVEDSKLVREGFLSAQDSGGHIKNLFLRDKKKKNYLVVLQEDAQVDLKQLASLLGASRLSFGSVDRLFECLGVRPGAVTPLSMITGCKHGVTLHLDKSIMSAQKIYMHPLVNDRTIGMSADELTHFFEKIGCQPDMLDTESLTGESE